MATYLVSSQLAVKLLLPYCSAAVVVALTEAGDKGNRKQSRYWSRERLGTYQNNVASLPFISTQTTTMMAWETYLPCSHIKCSYCPTCCHHQYPSGSAPSPFPLVMVRMITKHTCNASFRIILAAIDDVGTGVLHSVAYLTIKKRCGECSINMKESKRT